MRTFQTTFRIFFYLISTAVVVVFSRPSYHFVAKWLLSSCMKYNFIDWADFSSLLSLFRLLSVSLAQIKKFMRPLGFYENQWRTVRFFLEFVCSGGDVLQRNWPQAICSIQFPTLENFELQNSYNSLKSLKRFSSKWHWQRHLIDNVCEPDGDWQFGPNENQTTKATRQLSLSHVLYIQSVNIFFRSAIEAVRR